MSEAMSSEVAEKEKNRQELFDVYGESLNSSERVIFPASEEEMEAFTRNLEIERLNGSFVALVDGAFDVPHPSHEWYLRHCRLVAVKTALESTGQNATIENMRLLAASGHVKLVVTVDADEKVADLKGGKAEKGGSQRPIYPWKARADRVAGYSFTHDYGLAHTVDFVTVEGAASHRGTPWENSLLLAKHLAEQGGLDRLIVYGEHSKTVDAAKVSGVPFSVIPQHSGYCHDPFTGEEWSSSAIIRRAQKPSET